ncbi:TadG family pilus assembly protein [Devosia sp.]|uniref:TadG family pilus assembly protein n=1 Tax=Devosia sp. TaxID=1871048 RepID=UPI002AFF5E50|nr:TadG family pilus assembly protein [Devosia sp.]
MSGFWRDCRANMAVLFAMGFAISALVSAVAIDAAALYHERRVIQSAVDLAALTAARNPQRAQALAQSALVEAGLLAPGVQTGLVVQAGRYDPDPALDASARFTPGRTPFNAVAVRFEQKGRLHFADGWAEPPLLGARAVASVTPEVAFTLGSRLAALKDGIANLALNQLLGSKVNLTLLDYRALAGLEVDMFAFLDALAGELGVTAGTYDQLLALRADRGQLARALSTLGNAAQRLVLQKLINQLGKDTVALNRLIAAGKLGELDIGSAGAQGLFTTVSALDLLAASATLGDGQHMLHLPLGAEFPGFLSLDADLVVGEPPQGGGWLRIGEAGAVVRTAQARLRLVAGIGGKGALLGETIRLPLYLEAAHAEAMVGAATCPGAGAERGTARILVRPGALRLMIGELGDPALADFGASPRLDPARLVEVKLLGLTILQVFGSSLVELAQTQPIALDFSSADIAGKTVRTARLTTPASGLTKSLFDNLKLHAPILGLGLNLSSLGQLLGTILSPLAPTLDQALMGVLRTAGLSLGEADVVVHGVRCGAPALVG